MLQINNHSHLDRNYKSKIRFETCQNKKEFLKAGFPLTWNGMDRIVLVKNQKKIHCYSKQSKLIFIGLKLQRSELDRQKKVKYFLTFLWTALDRFGSQNGLRKWRQKSNPVRSMKPSLRRWSQISNIPFTCSSGSRRSHSTAIEKLNDLKIVLHAL